MLLTCVALRLCCVYVVCPDIPVTVAPLSMLLLGELEGLLRCAERRADVHGDVSLWQSHFSAHFPVQPFARGDSAAERAHIKHWGYISYPNVGTTSTF